MTYDEIKEVLPNLDINEKCAICWDRLSDPSEELKYYKILPCSHPFHSVCINEELSNYSYHCPICKKECGESEAIIEGDEEEYSSSIVDIDDDEMPGLSSQLPGYTIDDSISDNENINNDIDDSFTSDEKINNDVDNSSTGEGE